MTKLTGVKAVLADPKRLAKWKSNPGLRGKLPEKYLTPEQRLARRMGQEIFPGAGITGFEQARQAKSATDQVYGPQKIALQDQANTVAAQRQRNAGWWDQYVGQLRAMQAPAANTQAGPDVGAQYGAPAGPGTQQVQASAGGYQQALSSLAAGMLQNNVASGGQRKLESLAGLDAVELGVKQKQGALQKEADLFKQDQKTKIASTARQTFLEDIAYRTKDFAAQSKAALDAQKAATEKRDKEQRRILTRQQQRETSRSNAQREAIAREKANKNPKKTAKAKPLPKGSALQVKQFQTAYGDAQRFIAHSPEYGSDAVHRWLLRNKAGKSGVSPLLLEAAAQAARDGKIHTKTAERIRKQLGIRVRDFGYKVG